MLEGKSLLCGGTGKPVRKFPKPVLKLIPTTSHTAAPQIMLKSRRPYLFNAQGMERKILRLKVGFLDQLDIN